MNLKEAYKELGLNEDASPEEVKKAFKKKALKYHPDRNKDPKAEDKFKRINKAKEIIDNPLVEKNFSGFSGFDFSSFMKDENIRPKVYHKDPDININLTFLESVLGVEKEVSYDKYDKCLNCQGKGEIQGNNICKVCNGAGGKVTSKGYMQAISVCGACKGTGKEIFPCTKCKGTGTIKKQVTHKIKIPYGVKDQNILRIEGAGHFVGTQVSKISNFINFGSENVDVYGNVYLKINVKPDLNMRISESGSDIESDINITLLEALEGTNIKVDTIKGELTLNINKNIKNKEQIVLNGYGPGYIGKHIFNINVSYPNDTSKLIEILKKE